MTEAIGKLVGEIEGMKAKEKVEALGAGGGGGGGGAGAAGGANLALSLMALGNAANALNGANSAAGMINSFSGAGGAGAGAGGFGAGIPGLGGALSGAGGGGAGGSLGLGLAAGGGGAGLLSAGGRNLAMAGQMNALSGGADLPGVLALGKTLFSRQLASQINKGDVTRKNLITRNISKKSGIILPKTRYSDTITKLKQNSHVVSGSRRSEPGNDEEEEREKEERQSERFNNEGEEKDTNKVNGADSVMKAIGAMQLTGQLSQDTAATGPSQNEIASSVAAGIASGILSGGNELLSKAKSNGLFDAVAKGFSKMSSANIAAIQSAAQRAASSVNAAAEKGKAAIGKAEAAAGAAGVGGKAEENLAPSFLIGKAAANAAKNAKQGLTPKEIATLTAEAALHTAGILSGIGPEIVQPQPVVHEYHQHYSHPIPELVHDAHHHFHDDFNPMMEQGVHHNSHNRYGHGHNFRHKSNLNHHSGPLLHHGFMMHPGLLMQHGPLMHHGGGHNYFGDDGEFDHHTPVITQFHHEADDIGPGWHDTSTMHTGNGGRFAEAHRKIDTDEENEGDHDKGEGDSHDAAEHGEENEDHMETDSHESNHESSHVKEKDTHGKDTRHKSAINMPNLNNMNGFNLPHLSYLSSAENTRADIGVPNQPQVTGGTLMKSVTDLPEIWGTDDSGRYKQIDPANVAKYGLNSVVGNAIDQNIGEYTGPTVNGMPLTQGQAGAKAPVYDLGVPMTPGMGSYRAGGIYDVAMNPSGGNNVQSGEIRTPVQHLDQSVEKYPQNTVQSSQRHVTPGMELDKSWTPVDSSVSHLVNPSGRGNEEPRVDDLYKNEKENHDTNEISHLPINNDDTIKNENEILKKEMYVLGGTKDNHLDAPAVTQWNGPEITDPTLNSGYEKGEEEEKEDDHGAATENSEAKEGKAENENENENESRDVQNEEDVTERDRSFDTMNSIESESNAHSQQDEKRILGLMSDLKDNLSGPEDDFISKYTSENGVTKENVKKDTLFYPILSMLEKRRKRGRHYNIHGDVDAMHSSGKKARKYRYIGDSSSYKRRYLKSFANFIQTLSDIDRKGSRKFDVPSLLQRLPKNHLDQPNGKRKAMKRRLRKKLECLVNSLETLPFRTVKKDLSPADFEDIKRFAQSDQRIDLKWNELSRNQDIKYLKELHDRFYSLPHEFLSLIRKQFDHDKLRQKEMKEKMGKDMRGSRRSWYDDFVKYGPEKYEDTISYSLNDIKTDEHDVSPDLISDFQKLLDQQEQYRKYKERKEARKKKKIRETKKKEKEYVGNNNFFNFEKLAKALQSMAEQGNFSTNGTSSDSKNYLDKITPKFDDMTNDTFRYKPKEYTMEGTSRGAETWPVPVFNPKAPPEAGKSDGDNPPSEPYAQDKAMEDAIKEPPAPPAPPPPPAAPPNFVSPLNSLSSGDLKNDPNQLKQMMAKILSGEKSGAGNLPPPSVTNSGAGASSAPVANPMQGVDPQQAIISTLITQLKTMMSPDDAEKSQNTGSSGIQLSPPSIGSTYKNPNSEPKKAPAQPDPSALDQYVTPEGPVPAGSSTSVLSGNAINDSPNSYKLVGNGLGKPVLQPPTASNAVMNFPSGSTPTGTGPAGSVSSNPVSPYGVGDSTSPEATGVSPSGGKIVSSGFPVYSVPLSQSAVQSPPQYFRPAPAKQGPNPYEVLTSDMIFPGNYFKRDQSMATSSPDPYFILNRNEETVNGRKELPTPENVNPFAANGMHHSFIDQVQDEYYKEGNRTRLKELEEEKKKMRGRRKKRLPVVFKYNNNDDQIDVNMHEWNDYDFYTDQDEHKKMKKGRRNEIETESKLYYVSEKSDESNTTEEKELQGRLVVERKFYEKFQKNAENDSLDLVGINSDTSALNNKKQKQTHQIKSNSIEKNNSKEAEPETSENEDYIADAAEDKSTAADTKAVNPPKYVPPEPPSNGPNPYEIMTSDQLFPANWNLKSCINENCRRHHVRQHGVSKKTNQIILKRCSIPNCQKRDVAGKYTSDAASSREFDPDDSWLEDVPEHYKIANHLPHRPLHPFRYSTPVYTGTHENYGDYQGSGPYSGGYANDHHTQSYPAEHHEWLGPAEGHPTHYDGPNADPQHIGQKGHFGEPGLGGSGPYRGPTEQHHDEEHHKLPVPVIIKPPPPIHGQNPYEVLTSDQMHDGYIHDAAQIQLQHLESEHEPGHHSGPIFNVPTTNRLTYPDLFHYRRCGKGQKCRVKTKTKINNHKSMFDIIRYKNENNKLQNKGGNLPNKTKMRHKGVKKLTNVNETNINLGQIKPRRNFRTKAQKKYEYKTMKNKPVRRKISIKKFDAIKGKTYLKNRADVARRHSLEGDEQFPRLHNKTMLRQSKTFHGNIAGSSPGNIATNTLFSLKRSFIERSNAKVNQKFQYYNAPVKTGMPRTYVKRYYVPPVGSFTQAYSSYPFVTPYGMTRH